MLASDSVHTIVRLRMDQPWLVTVGLPLVSTGCLHSDGRPHHATETVLDASSLSPRLPPSIEAGEWQTCVDMRACVRACVCVDMHACLVDPRVAALCMRLGRQEYLNKTRC